MHRRLAYYAARVSLLAVSVALTLVLIWWMVGPQLKNRVRAGLVRWAFENLPEDAVRELYRVVREETGYFFDTVPDPLVASLGKPGLTVRSKGAVLRFNNAVMRASRPFHSKLDSYRIVCLGDSFVMGTGGPEEDRFCDQLASFYRDRGIEVGGQPIETLALGIGGWTLLQSVTYLTTRLSARDGSATRPLCPSAEHGPQRSPST